MRYLHKIAIAFSVVLLFPLPARSQTTTRRTAQTQHRTLRPQPRSYQAFHSHTFTGIATDVGILVRPLIGFHQITWTTTGTITACQVQVDGSANGTTWTGAQVIPSQPCASSGQSTVHQIGVYYIRLNMTNLTCTGSCSVLVDYYGFTSNPGGGGGGPPPNVGQFVLHGNPTNATAGPIYFTPGGDFSYNPGSTAATPLFSVNALHFGATALTLSTTAPTSAQCLTVTGTTIGGGTCGSGGGGTGNVTASPVLNPPHLPKATGPTTIADSLFTDSGAIGLYAGSSLGVGAGDTSCGSTSGCIGLTEGTSAVGTVAPINHQWLRADFASHSLKAANGTAEYFVPQLTNTGQAGQAILSNGNGTFTAVDPLVSFNHALLFNNTTITTGTNTGSIVPNPLGSGYGTLSVTALGIFSAGVCTISLYSAVITNPGAVTGNINNNPFATVTFAFSNALPTQSFPIIPDPTTAPGTGQGADAVAATLNCSTQPGSGAGITAVLSPGITAGPPFTCNRKQFINATVAGVSTLVAAVPNTKVYVCGWTVNTAATSAGIVVELTQGATCAIGNTAFSEAVALQSLTNSAPVGAVNNAPSNVVDATPVGQALCLSVVGTPGTSTPIFGKIWYAQF